MSLDSKQQAMADIGRYLQRANYHFVTVTPQTHQYYWQRHHSRLATSLRDVFGEELLKDDYHDVERIAAVVLTLRKLG